MEGVRIMPKKGYKQTKEHIEKCRIPKIGKPSGMAGKNQTEYQKNKQSQDNKGYKNPMFGIHLSGWHHTKEATERMSESKLGERNPNWISDRSLFEYPDDWTETLRESIRQRDGYICFLCEVHQDELEKKLSVHHIDYNKYNLDPKNLISLCRNCHLKTNQHREYWIKYFYGIKT